MGKVTTSNPEALAKAQSEYHSATIHADAGPADPADNAASAPNAFSFASAGGGAVTQTARYFLIKTKCPIKPVTQVHSGIPLS